MTRFLKIITLFVPSWTAAIVVLKTHPTDGMLRVAAPILVVMWVMMLGVIVMRALEASKPRSWNLFDVLTSAGRSTMWAGSLAIVLAAIKGWASLSLLGVLGLGVVFLSTIWVLLAAGGTRPWKNAKIARQILPELATEGDSIREELRVGGLVVPAGTRWFATGRVVRNGVVTRYTLTGEASESEVVLESDLGAVARGEHHSPPLAMWFGDMLGMARTPVQHRAPALFTVLPKPIVIDGAKDLLGPGGFAMTETPAQRMPTEGTFRIREYAPGDDTRRIHWVRSLAANQLVVRLPDEIPPADPSVRLVLDNHLWGTEMLTCRGHEELLDALVRVWLGVGKVLADSGSRVTMVTAADAGKGLARLERPMLARTPREALRLGARAKWQSTIPLSSMLATGKNSPTKQLVVSTRPQRIDTAPTADVSWIVLPEGAWTGREPEMPAARHVLLPFPAGSGDNRYTRRQLEVRRIATMWRDRAIFSEMVSWLGASKTGAYVALQTPKGVKLQVLP